MHNNFHASFLLLILIGIGGLTNRTTEEDKNHYKKRTIQMTHEHNSVLYCTTCTYGRQGGFECGWSHQEVGYFKLAMLEVLLCVYSPMIP
jgi:hypothetical protein